MVLETADRATLLADISTPLHERGRDGFCRGCGQAWPCASVYTATDVVPPAGNSARPLYDLEVK